MSNSQSNQQMGASLTNSYNFSEQDVKAALQSFQTFSQTKPIRLEVLKGNQSVIAICIAVICGTLKEKFCVPINKLLALKFTKDLVETLNDDLISSVQKSPLLGILEKIALFRANDQDDSRGKQFFHFDGKATKELEDYGNSFLTLCLECLFVWARWFPIDPENFKLSAFKITYEKLVYLKVKFPALTYFDFHDVKKNLPETGVPREMLAELRTLTKGPEFRQSQTKNIQSLLKKSVKLPDGRGTVFQNDSYADLLAVIVDKVRKRKDELHLGHDDGNNSKHSDIYVQNNGQPDYQEHFQGKDQQQFQEHFQDDQQLRVTYTSPPQYVQSIYSPNHQNEELNRFLATNQQHQLQQYQEIIKEQNSIHSREILWQQQLALHINEKSELQNKLTALMYEKNNIEKEYVRQKQLNQEQCAKINELKAQLLVKDNDLRIKQKDFEEIKQSQNLNQDMKQPSQPQFQNSAPEQTSKMKELIQQSSRQELKIQRLQSELDRYKMLSESQEKTIDNYMQQAQEMDEKIFKSISEKDDVENKNQQDQQLVARQNKQIIRLQDQVKQLQEELKNLKHDNQRKILGLSEQVQSLQNDRIQDLYEKSKFKDESSHLSSELGLKEKVSQSQLITISNLEDQKAKLINEKNELIRQLNLQNIELDQQRKTTQGFQQSRFQQPAKTGVNFYPGNQTLTKFSISQRMPQSQIVQQQFIPQSLLEQEVVAYNPNIFECAESLIDFRFKQAAFKEKLILYQDEYVQIGTILKLGESPQQLVIQLYYTSVKKVEPVRNVSVQFSFSSNNLQVDIQPLSQYSIQNQDQIKQEIKVTYSQPFFPVIIGNMLYDNLKIPKQFLIPVTIVKFFQYQEFNPQKYPAEKFQLITEQFPLEPKFSQLAQILVNFTQLQYPGQEELICSQVVIPGVDNLVNIRIVKYSDDKITIEVDAGGFVDVGRQVIASLISLLKK